VKVEMEKYCWGGDVGRRVERSPPKTPTMDMSISGRSGWAAKSVAQEARRAGDREGRSAADGRSLQVTSWAFQPRRGEFAVSRSAGV
jgi:hypothetical protein